MEQTSILKERMGNFIDSVNDALNHNNRYAALTVAVTLPDICCRLDGRKRNNHEGREAYERWFDEYVTSYQVELKHGSKEIIFLNGKNAYALRCAFLHDGAGDLSPHPARDQNLGIESIEFVHSDARKGLFPGTTETFTASIDDQTLILNVEEYCLSILDGINKWILDQNQNPDTQERASFLAVIKSQF